MNQKHLFLFAGYDPDGIIDPALIYYVQKLSRIGDVVLCMDCDCPTAEVAKIKPYVKHVIARRHGEYDFGSYKRAYLWAYETLTLADYDYVYLVNDSVYGPLYSMPFYYFLGRLEMRMKNADAFGLVCNPNRRHPHIQSWFIGMRPSVFLSDWFDAFMRGIKKLDSKGEITREYEHGFSRLVTKHGLSWRCWLTVHNRGVYNRPRALYHHDVPFVKKVTFTRHCGAYGGQLAYILRHIQPEVRDAILTSARNTYGREYMDWLLTRNPIKITYRKIKSGLKKIFSKS